MLKVKQIKKFEGIRAVGFDVDGTLYTYTPEVGIALSREVAHVAARELKKDEEEFVEEFLALRDLHRSHTLALNSLGLDGEAIYQSAMDNYNLEAKHQVDTRLVKMLEDLGKKYRLFIISNGTGRQVERKLKVLGLDPKDFDPRVYCYDMEWVKPEAEVFEYALKKLKLGPSEVVYVGDRVEVDIEGAKAVGMKTILVGAQSDKADASCETVYDIELMLRY